MDRRKDERAFENPPGPAKGGEAWPPGRGRFDERLDAILAAATLLFAREGFHQASMRQVAVASGTSLAGLYHYFDSKERLLFLIQFRAFSGLLTEVQAQLLGIHDPVEQLRILVHTHVQYAMQNMAELKICSHELDSLTGEAYEQVRRVRREYYELALAIIERILAERNPGSSLDVRIATMSLFGTLNWLYRWYDPGRERSPSTLASQILAQFLAALLHADPQRPAGAEPLSEVAAATRRKSGAARSRAIKTAP
jgi:TetR/AcrR family transcriptional regulator, cholesterol catabolism regulator